MKIHGPDNAGRQAATVRCPFLNPELDFGIQVANGISADLHPLGKLAFTLKPPPRCAAGAGEQVAFGAASDAVAVCGEGGLCIAHWFPLPWLFRGGTSPPMPLQRIRNASRKTGPITGLVGLAGDFFWVGES